MIDYSDIQQIEYILTHEYTHIRRFDILLKWLLAIALCIHWFNPLVWLMYIIANRDIELSCDEKVIQSLGEKKRSSYALALINLEETKSRINGLCARFSKNAIKERITDIMKTKKLSKSAILIAIILILFTTAVFATVPMYGSPDESDIPNLPGKSTKEVHSILNQLGLCFIIVSQDKTNENDSIQDHSFERKKRLSQNEL